MQCCLLFIIYLTFPSSIFPGRIGLQKLNISGSIPTTIGALSDLFDLVIIDSELTGEIPTELGYLSNLKRIVLVSRLLQNVFRKRGCNRSTP